MKIHGQMNYIVFCILYTKVNEWKFNNHKNSKDEIIKSLESKLKLISSVISDENFIPSYYERDVVIQKQNEKITSYEKELDYLRKWQIDTIEENRKRREN